MLKEVSPRIKRVALLIDPKITSFDYFFRSAEAAAPSLAVELVPARAESPAEIERAIESIAQFPDSGMFIPPGTTMLRNRHLIIALTARHRLPTVSGADLRCRRRSHVLRHR